MAKDCCFNKTGAIAVFRHMRNKQRFRKIEIHDILQRQPEVAEKQFRVGGRIYDKAVNSFQKEDDRNEFL